MDLQARGEALAARVRDALDAALTDHAARLVNAAARARRLPPHHLALRVPGLCHTHAPDRRVFDGSAADLPPCAYCRRRGNCFAAGGADGA